MYGNNINHTKILEIIKKNIFPHTFRVLKNCWENIFFRPEEAMFENWRKLVSSNKNWPCSWENHLLHKSNVFCAVYQMSANHVPPQLYIIRSVRVGGSHYLIVTETYGSATSPNDGQNLLIWRGLDTANRQGQTVFLYTWSWEKAVKPRLDYIITRP